MFFSGWKDRVVRSLNQRGVAATAWLAVLLLVKYLIQIPFRYLIQIPIRQAIQIPSRHLPRLSRSLTQLWKRCTTRNFENPFYQFLDRQYDRRFSVNTAGIDLRPTLLDPGVNAYSPIPRSTFFIVLRQIRIDYSKFVFIDFGCGRGKPLLLASELPFQAIIGIELSQVLARAAQDNWKTYRGPRKCQAFQVVHTDARQYELPRVPTVCFFYDPFKEAVVAKVLDNIRKSLADAPREIYVLYVTPSQRHLMDQSGFLEPVKQTAGYCIYRSRACS